MPDTKGLIPTGDKLLRPLVIDWKSAMDPWIEDLRLTAHSPATNKAYQWAGLKFGEWLDKHGLNLAEVNRHLVLEYREHCLSKRGWSHSTTQQHLSAMRSWFEWLYDSHEVDRRNPVSNMPKAKRGRAFKRNYLTDDEVRRIIEACDSAKRPIRGVRDQAMLLLMAFTGLRSIEVRRAMRCDLATKGSRQVLWVQGKGRLDKDEYVVIHPVAWNAMLKWLEVGHPKDEPSRPLFYSVGRSFGAPLTARGFINIVMRAFHDAGIVDPSKTAHSLRHTAITKADLGGADGVQIMWMARHRSIDTTTKYLHQARRLLDPAELHIRYEGLE